MPCTIDERMNRTRLSATARIFILLAAFCPQLSAVAGEVIPPAPARHFNDYAHVASDETARLLDAQLAQFERDTTAQFVVAIFPKMQSDASVNDYSLRIANAWKIGQKGKDNGLLLVVFIQDHKMRIETGRGFERIVTDAICQKIIDEQITPRFRKGDFDGGLTAAVNALIAATRGEYKGADAKSPSPTPTPSSSPSASQVESAK